jgi:hypothetical protein
MKTAQAVLKILIIFSFYIINNNKKRMVNQYKWLINTTHRTNESEIMDDFQLEGMN